MSGISIRQGVRNDLPEMQKLFADTISAVCSANYNAEQIQVWASGVADINRWNDIIFNQYVVVAETDGLIVGFATLKNRSCIDLFYVHKSFQGQGIAKRLYAEIEKRAVEHRAAKLTADVSITARPFFEKMGFRVTAKQTVIRQGVAFINYKMSIIPKEIDFDQLDDVLQRLKNNKNEK